MKLAAFLLLSSCIAGCLLYDIAGPETEALAFPSAQGFGAASKGGRGGNILFVKNLNDSGPGSLRQAIETTGPRIVVFEVAGTIVLKDMLRVTAPFMTIAGQTAPPPGITIQGRGCLDVRTHDVLVQHLRFRATRQGDWNEQNIDYFDGFQITGSAGYPPHKAYNVVFDHVSASGAADEGCSIWCARNVTISNSLIALNSKGVLIGNNSRDIALIGNLVMHNKTRQPRINCGVTANILRNIFYNGPDIQMQIGESKAAPGFTSRPYPDRPTMINIVENSFFSGPRTKNRQQPIQLLYAQQPLNAQSKVYLKNNSVDGSPLTSGKNFFWDTPGTPVPVQPVMELPDGAMLDSHFSVARLLATVGARPNQRDFVDALLIKDFNMRGESRYEDVLETLSGKSNYRAFKIPTNPHGDDDKNGFSNIEDYLHQLAIQVEQ